MARADPAIFAVQDKRAAAAAQVAALAVEIGAGHGAAATHANLIGALHSAAALAPIDEEIVVAVAVVQKWRFDLR